MQKKNGYNKDYIEDAKKRESMEGVVQSIVPGEDAQMAVMETFAGLHGREDYYKKHSGIKKGNNSSANNSSDNMPTTPTKRRGRPSGSSNTKKSKLIKMEERMHRYIQFYYQNRLKIWAIVLAIVFVIVLIQVINGFAKEENKNKDEEATRKYCFFW